MADAKTLEQIDQWVEDHWEDVIADIETLVNIPSQEDLDHATEGKPYGPGPAEALEAGLRMCERMGMKAENHEGYVGTADYVGDNDEKKIAIIGGTCWKDEDGTLHQSCDSRYPTTMNKERFEEILTVFAAKFGATYETDNDTVPFWIDPNGEEVQRLTKVYNDLTGENRSCYTLGGGTYCREFERGAAFGVEMPWRKDPDWVGPMHGDDEGISEDALKLSLKCYILGIKEIMEIEY